jgi:hypothetical protein
LSHVAFPQLNSAAPVLTKPLGQVNEAQLPLAEQHVFSQVDWVQLSPELLLVWYSVPSPLDFWEGHE